jgi:predicted dehydrogenase
MNALPSERPLRAAVIGAGLMGRWHAHAIRRAGGRVAVVIDRDERCAETLGRRFGARWSCSLTEQTEVDVVHVCTPLESHEDYVRRSIALGKHVLVEKPLTATAAVTESLLAAADAQRIVVCPVHQFPWQDGVRRIVDHLPTIGRLVHVSTIIYSAGARTDDAEERERIAADVLPHPLSLITAVLPSARVDSIDWAVRRPAPGELHALAEAGETALSISISLRGRPTSNSLHVIGTDGSGHADLFHGFAVLEHGTVSRRNKILHPFVFAASTLGGALKNLSMRAIRGEGAYPGLARLVKEFHSAARGEVPSPISSDAALAIARARDSLLDSHSSHEIRAIHRNE